MCTYVVQKCDCEEERSINAKPSKRCFDVSCVALRCLVHWSRVSSPRRRVHFLSPTAAALAAATAIGYYTRLIWSTDVLKQLNYTHNSLTTSLHCFLREKVGGSEKSRLFGGCNKNPRLTRSPASAGIANRPLVFATITTLSGHNIEYLCLNLFTPF